MRGSRIGPSVNFVQLLTLLYICLFLIVKCISFVKILPFMGAFHVFICDLQIKLSWVELSWMVYGPKWFGAEMSFYRKGIKPGTNARDPGPKSGTKFCQQNIAIKHAYIELKFGSNVDYRLFFEMHISIFFICHIFIICKWNIGPCRGIRTRDQLFRFWRCHVILNFRSQSNWYCPSIDLFSISNISDL